MVVRGKARAIGQIGEERAVEHLVGLGWQVLDRNWRCNEGELDVVAHDPHAGALVVVEGKCRSGLGFGDPLEAVTWRKRSKIRQLSLLWLAEHRLRADRLRIDAIGVLLQPGRKPVLSHAQGIDE